MIAGAGLGRLALRQDHGGVKRAHRAAGRRIGRSVGGQIAGDPGPHVPVVGPHGIAAGGTAGFDIEGPRTIRVRADARRGDQINVVAHEGHGPLPEERQIRRIEGELLGDIRARHDTEGVFGELRRLKNGRGSRIGLRETNVHRVPRRLRVGRIEDLKLIDEGAEHFRNVLTQVVIDQRELAPAKGKRRHQLMAEAFRLVNRVGRRPRGAVVFQSRHDDS